MPVIRLLGSDTIRIGSRIITDLADGEVAKLSYEGDLVSAKSGKNGNTIYAKNEAGELASFELHVLRGSADDKFLNEELVKYKQDPSRYVLLNGELTKVLGDGAGKVTQDTYIMIGGLITKNVEGVSNVEGDTAQAVSLYSMKFSLAPRSIA